MCVHGYEIRVDMRVYSLASCQQPEFYKYKENDKLVTIIFKWFCLVPGGHFSWRETQKTSLEWHCGTYKQLLLHASVIQKKCKINDSGLHQKIAEM